MEFIDKLEKRSASFWNKVETYESDRCWLWRGYIDINGYGRTSFRGKPITAHRLHGCLKIGNLLLKVRWFYVNVWFVNV